MPSIGPRLLSRGKVTKSYCDAYYCVPSIGPRLLSRGKVTKSYCDAYYCVPSIGPRLLSRGKRRVLCKYYSGRDPSIGPRLLSRGKSDSYISRVRCCASFNWAAASQPRKGEVPQQIQAIIDKLQLGRGFSAAESFEGVDDDGYKDIASIGPRLLSRGKRHPAVRRHAGFGASIGPRLLSRGKRLWVVVHVSLSFASIGPRLLSRGKPRHNRSGTVRFTLQLGRGFSAAESSYATSETLTINGLQLGRGFSAAESALTI